MYVYIHTYIYKYTHTQLYKRTWVARSDEEAMIMRKALKKKKRKNLKWKFKNMILKYSNFKMLLNVFKVF